MEKIYINDDFLHQHENLKLFCVTRPLKRKPPRGFYLAALPLTPRGGGGAVIKGGQAGGVSLAFAGSSAKFKSWVRATTVVKKGIGEEGSGKKGINWG